MEKEKIEEVLTAFQKPKSKKAMEKGKVFFVMIFLLALLLAVVSVWAMDQKNKIESLTFHLKTEQKKAAEWESMAKVAQEGDLKAQAVLKEKDAEIAFKSANLKACQEKVVALSKPPAKQKQRAAKKVDLAKASVAKAAVMAPKAEKTSELGRPIPAPAPVPAQITVPAVAPTSQFIVRIVVVEWSPMFQGKSLMSKDIGPIVQKGLDDGTVIRAKEPLNFTINGASVMIRNGDAIVNPGQISAATALVIRPVDGAKFASPPNGSVVATSSGDLKNSLDRGAREFRITLVLAPPAPPAVMPPTPPATTPPATVPSLEDLKKHPQGALAEGLKGAFRPFSCFYKIMETEAGKKNIFKY